MVGRPRAGAADAHRQRSATAAAGRVRWTAGWSDADGKPGAASDRAAQTPGRRGGKAAAWRRATLTSPAAQASGAGAAGGPPAEANGRRAGRAQRAPTLLVCPSAEKGRRTESRRTFGKLSHDAPRITRR